jgi:iron complex outermembrane receptor protein
VNLQSKTPTGGTFGEIGTSFGNLHTAQGFFDFGGVIDDDGVYQYRVTGLARTTETQAAWYQLQRPFDAPLSPTATSPRFFAG